MVNFHLPKHLLESGGASGSIPGGRNFILPKLLLLYFSPKNDTCDIHILAIELLQSIINPLLCRSLFHTFQKLFPLEG